MHTDSKKKKKRSWQRAFGLKKQKKKEYKEKLVDSWPKFVQTLCILECFVLVSKTTFLLSKILRGWICQIIVCYYYDPSPSLSQSQSFITQRRLLCFHIRFSVQTTDLRRAWNSCLPTLSSNWIISLFNANEVLAFSSKWCCLRCNILSIIQTDLVSLTLAIRD